MSEKSKSEKFKLKIASRDYVSGSLKITPLETMSRKMSEFRVWRLCLRFPIQNNLQTRFMILNHHDLRLSRPIEEHNTISLMVARSYLRCLVPFESKIYCIMFFNDQEKNEKKKKQASKKWTNT